MDTLVTGIHHITLCPGSAQADVDFFTGVLGQRLVKQAVLLDGNIPVYHFYYGNADGEPGSIATCFPYRRRKGRPGSGQVSTLTYAVPKGSLSFWAAHLAQQGALEGGLDERFGAAFVRARHPAGQTFELMEADDPRRPWTTCAIGADVATRGFHAAVLSVREVAETEQFFVDALGFRKVGVDGDYHRLALPGGGPASIVDLHHQPDRAPGSWTLRRGHVPPHRLRGPERRAADEPEGVVRGAGLHRRVRGEGSLLLPLDVRAGAGRDPGGVHGQRRRGVLHRRDARRVGDPPEPSTVVRRPAVNHRVDARGRRAARGQPAAPAQAARLPARGPSCRRPCRCPGPTQSSAPASAAAWPPTRATRRPGTSRLRASAA